MQSELQYFTKPTQRNVTNLSKNWWQETKLAKRKQKLPPSLAVAGLGLLITIRKGGI